MYVNGHWDGLLLPAGRKYRGLHVPQTTPFAYRTQCLFRMLAVLCQFFPLHLLCGTVRKCPVRANNFHLPHFSRPAFLFQEILLQAAFLFPTRLHQQILRWQAQPDHPEKAVVPHFYQNLKLLLHMPIRQTLIKHPFRKISDHLMNTMRSASPQIIQDFAACFGLPVFFQRL